MPVIRMAFAPSEIPADAANVRLASAEYQDREGSRVPEGEAPQSALLFLYDTFVGLCLEEIEENGRDDSDFVMVVWNPEAGEPFRTTFASTRGWTYPCYGSRADATPEVRAAYEAYRQRQRDEMEHARREREARLPRKGSRVRVVGGRKAPKGTEAEVFWLGDRPYRYGFVVEREWRVGLRLTSGEKVFVNASQIEVIA